MGAKALAKRVVPSALWVKLFKLRHEVWRGWTERHIRAALLAKIGSPKTPLNGPFADMRYINQATGSAFFPKLLGTYELEIKDAVEWIVDFKPDVIVNVGCAEGYYAVGMARRCKEARIIAFDIESRARRLVAQLADINGVAGQMDIRRRCTRANLQPICAEAAKPVVIVDCEGFEDHLLDPRAVPALDKAVMLVEVHDCFVPGLSPRMRQRFAGTHLCVTFQPRPRRLDDLPQNVQLDDAEALRIMDEARGETCWMLLIPLPVAAAASEEICLHIDRVSELRAAV